jgi:ethanolamine utilization protein EutS
MKAANVEVVFVDRFNGSLIINGDVADVETAVREVMGFLENTLQFAPTIVTKS